MMEVGRHEARQRGTATTADAYDRQRVNASRRGVIYIQQTRRRRDDRSKRSSRDPTRPRPILAASRDF